MDPGREVGWGFCYRRRRREGWSTWLSSTDVELKDRRALFHLTRCGRGSTSWCSFRIAKYVYFSFPGTFHVRGRPRALPLSGAFFHPPDPRASKRKLCLLILFFFFLMHDVVHPLPQCFARTSHLNVELFDHIVDFLYDSVDALRSCCLVSK